MRTPRLLFIVITGLALLGPAARPASAQLISPGKLSEVHSELEGIRACTNCHQLREKGVDRDLCLACHTPLRTRIEAGEGYHSTEGVSSDCAECHKEHFGRDFDLVRWEPTEFDHGDVGWAPEEAHAKLECRECHAPVMIRSLEVRTFKGRYGALSRTYLGLGTECAACHQKDDPHEGQFADQACEGCHDQRNWENPAGFDHDAARYRLTGLHTEVECAGCHPPVQGAPGSRVTTAGSAPALQFTGIPFAQCSNCHRDEHEGGMGATCSACHVTSGWERVREEDVRDRFDHDAVFALEGAHEEAECAACHSPARADTEALAITFRTGTEGRTYPSPVAEGCESCHVDEHEGEFVRSAEGGACDRCHGQEQWYPADYDFRRHNEETRFPLEGAHVATPCLACHPSESASLATSTARPPRASDFRFRIGLPGCADCHVPSDPHEGQFSDAACDSCHRSDTFAIDDFDHDRTAYPLDGAHEEVACSECHKTEPRPGGGTMIRYRPLGSECTDCHGGGV
ncbi:MAG: cytochrome c3 family protein [Candidatus Palauibacterales bacterium]|nr:cytochrome c3 family protein [Candidatus Palauibacterales bacterium]MDP2483377.1 cytochrome c3 family protein [Candidatus Palauibacterales bacterium]